MNKIDQKGSIIIPFLLTLDKKDHYFIIENKMNQQNEKKEK